MALFSNVRVLATVLGLALFTTNLAAQSITVTPGGGLTGGSKANINYENRAKAGQTVVVTVTGGFPIVTTIEIPVTLDATGKGSATWVVASWTSASFNAPDANSVSVSIR